MVVTSYGISQSTIYLIRFFWKRLLLSREMNLRRILSRKFYSFFKSERIIGIYVFLDSVKTRLRTRLCITIILN